MKTILCSLLALTITLSAHAARERKPAAAECATLPAPQQTVWKAFNAYVASGQDVDAVFYIGVLSQYQTDVDAWAPKNDPNFGNSWAVNWSESDSANRCAKGGYDVVEKRALGGDRTAIKLVLMFSAVGSVDGASAEDLSELQGLLKKKFPKVLDEIQKTDHTFFKAHPINWIEMGG